MTHTLETGIATVVGALDAISDPMERYRKAQEAKPRFDGALKGVHQRIALELHASGKPWREVGEIMGGVTAQRAWQISRGE